MKRKWIKLYVDQCLRGTMMSELPAEERWIWVGLLLMAGDSNVEGAVYKRKGEEDDLLGFSDSTIGELLAVEPLVYMSAKEKLIRYEKIRIDKNNVIYILNWAKYQSEYQRQRKYRGDDKSYKRNSNFNCNQSNSLDLDIDKEQDKELREEERECLNLLNTIKNYPFNFEKDLEHIRKLFIEFPKLNILEEVKNKCAWWTDNPILKKHNPRSQLRNWMKKAVEFRKERDQSGRVGEHEQQGRYRPATKEEEEFNIAYDLKVEEIKQKYATEFEKVASGSTSAIHDKMRDEISEWSKNYKGEAK